MKTPSPTEEATVAVIRTLSELPPLHEHPAIASATSVGDIDQLARSLATGSGLVGGEDLFQLQATSRIFAEKLTFRSFGQWVGQLFQPIEQIVGRFSLLLRGPEEAANLGSFLDAVFAEVHSAEMAANRIIEQAQFAAGHMPRDSGAGGRRYGFTALRGTVLAVEGEEAPKIGHVWFQPDSASPGWTPHRSQRGVPPSLATTRISQMGMVADTAELASHCERATNGLGILRIVARELGPKKTAARFVTEVKFLAARFPGPLPEIFTKLTIGLLIFLPLGLLSDSSA